jgi:hypothetical protein
VRFRLWVWFGLRGWFGLLPVVRMKNVRPASDVVGLPRLLVVACHLRHLVVPTSTVLRRMTSRSLLLERVLR